MPAPVSCLTSAASSAQGTSWYEHAEEKVTVCPGTGRVGLGQMG